MIYPELTEETLFITSDLTAGIFLIILILSISFRTEKRPENSHLLASAIMELAGMFMRLFASTVEKIPADFAWKQASHFLTPVAAPVIWIISFIFISIGITESAKYVIYVNGGKRKSSFKTRFTANSILLAAGTILYMCTGSINVFTIAIMVQFIYFYLHLYICCSDSVMCQFGRASLVALITLAIALFFTPLRFTGLGLSVMLIILNEQYHNQVVRELEEREKELAKGKVQLLAEQISPHYIYNSLQSIKELCETDPFKARNAIDYFSEYLRDNLESLTIEELIPFTRELEFTEAYLELEKLTGRSMFDVEYQLETTDFMLPPLVLQPVVENAVKHGALRAVPGVGNRTEAATEIIISTHKSGGYIIIEVTDRTEMQEHNAVTNTVGSNSVAGDVYSAEAGVNTKNSGKKKSVALENISTRLALQCGGTIETDSRNDGTKVRIILPESTQSKLP